MSDRRREKLAEKFKEKANWKTENLALLNRAKKAEAQLKDASEIIGKVQKWVKDTFDLNGTDDARLKDLAKIIGVETPKKVEVK
jgi:transposase